jgi:MoaA/NifB/PqqE/SkfB family radical SAM enzyme
MATRIVRKDGLPLHLIFFITNRCDFACEHCFLIAANELNNKSRQLLTLDEIERIAHSVPDLTALSLTGGEPFLRKDYGEIVRAFAKAARLQTLSTVSNGVKAERIVPQLEPLLRDLDLSVFLTLSLDGSEQAHDRIRRKPGAFARTLDTLRQLKGLRERFPRFSIGVNSTYIGSNFDDLMALYDVLEEVRPHFVTLNMMRGVDWQDRPDNLDVEEYRRLNARKNRLMDDSGRRTPLQRVIAAKDQVMTDLIAETYAQNRSLGPCYAGRLMGVIKDNGEVFACEQLSKPLGNLRDYDYDFGRVWTSETAEAERQAIKARKCHCTYECVMSSNILFNPAHYPRLLKAL